MTVENLTRTHCDRCGFTETYQFNQHHPYLPPRGWCKILISDSDGELFHGSDTSILCPYCRLSLIELLGQAVFSNLYPQGKED